MIFIDNIHTLEFAQTEAKDEYWMSNS